MATDLSPQLIELGKFLSLALLPEEIMIEILLWLPIKSINRFKCTCKSWKALFSDPGFTEIHLQRAIATKKKCLLVRHLSLPYPTTEFNAEMMARLDIECRRALAKGRTFGELLEETFSLLSNKCCEEMGRVKVPPLPPPPVDEDGTSASLPSYFTIIDSCNGIVCLADCAIDGQAPLLEVFLWNPSTAEVETLPSYHENRYEGYVIVSAYGFAFHPNLKDYQLVRIVNHYDENSYVAELYSLRDDYWKTIPAEDNINVCRILNSTSQAFVNDAFHWVASKEVGQLFMNPYFFVLAFDTIKEDFAEISLPEECDYTMDEYLLHKSAQIDSLSLVVCRIYQGFEVWVMKEYGVAASWMKERVVRCSTVEIMKPLHVLEDEKMVMERYGNDNEVELVLCDLYFQVIQYIHTFKKPMRIVNHLESQVALRDWRRELEI